MLNLAGCMDEVHFMPRLRHVEHGRAPSHYLRVSLMVFFIKTIRIYDGWRDTFACSR